MTIDPTDKVLVDAVLGRPRWAKADLRKHGENGDHRLGAVARPSYALDG